MVVCVRDAGLREWGRAGGSRCCSSPPVACRRSCRTPHARARPCPPPPPPLPLLLSGHGVPVHERAPRVDDGARPGAALRQRVPTLCSHLPVAHDRDCDRGRRHPGDGGLRPSRQHAVQRRGAAVGGCAPGGGVEDACTRLAPHPPANTVLPACPPTTPAHPLTHHTRTPSPPPPPPHTHPKAASSFPSQPLCC